MKYLLILTLSLFVFNNNKALSNVLPNDIFSAIEVVELQMTSLQTNSEDKQCRYLPMLAFCTSRK